MAESVRHAAFLTFIQKVAEVPSGYTMADLLAFRDIAAKSFSGFVPLIDEYICLAEHSESDGKAAGKKRKHKTTDDPSTMHLFDLLREKTLFPMNSDLADFAARILPNMKRNRFGKIARGEIAARIIEYLETRDPRTRADLEKSMRDVVLAGEPKPAERRDFFSKWEKIIKGIPL